LPFSFFSTFSSLPFLPFLSSLSLRWEAACQIQRGLGQSPAAQKKRKPIFGVFMSQGYACNEQNLKNAILRDNNLLQFYFGGVLTAKTPLFTALQCHRRQSIRKKEDPNHASMCIGLLCNWFTQRRKILLSTIESDKLFFIKVTHFLH